MVLTRVECGQQLLVNRHLVLWELRHLADGHGYAEPRSTSRPGSTIATRRSATRTPPWSASATCAHAGCADGRAAGVDPARARRARRPVVGHHDDRGGFGAVTVQADLTVLAPPDLRHDLVVELDAIAGVLREQRRAVDVPARHRSADPRRAGRPDTVRHRRLPGCISSARLPDIVVRLIHDAAARAGSVRVIAAPGRWWSSAMPSTSDGVRDQGAQADQADRYRRRHRRPARQGAHGARAQRAGSGGGDRRWRAAARSSADEAVAAAQQAAALRAGRPPRQRLRATRPGAGRAGQIDGRRAGPARCPRAGDRHRGDARRLDATGTS